jgi:ATP-dependent Clp protease ATP-binding subunit ClpC
MATYPGSGQFTEPFRDALSRTMEEAQKLHHRQIGTSHLLIGILAVETTAGSTIMRSMGVTLEVAMAALEGIPTEANLAQPDEVTDAVRQVLDFGTSNNRYESDGSIGTEALVLGLLESGDSPNPYDRAGSLLARLGVTPEKVEAELERRRRVSAERIDH